MLKRLFPYLLLAPTFIFLVGFTYVPLIRALIDSLHDSRLFAESPPFVGMDNFIRLLQDPVFWLSVRNNGVYILLTVIPGIVLALVLAVWLTDNSRINGWLRTAFFFPTIIPLVSAATLWTFIFIPNLGLLDYYLGKVAGPLSVNYLGMGNSAMLALAAVGIWKFAGYYMLFFLAALQGLPASPREAAIMEGAGRRQVFFYITLPLLRPTLNFVVIIALVYAITQIDHVVIMTQGGPNNATSVVLFYIQNLANNSHDFGKASAATFFTMVALFVISILNLRTLEKGVHYER